MSMSKVVYIASPYTLGDVEENVRHSIDIAEYISTVIGAIPVVPLLSHYWDKYYPHDWDFWMKICKEQVKRSDAIFRVEGESKGADIEVAIAKEHGIPVFESLHQLKLWVDQC